MAYDWDTKLFINSLDIAISFNVKSFSVAGNTYVFTLPASKIHRGQVIGSVDAKDADQGVNGQVRGHSNNT